MQEPAALIGRKFFNNSPEHDENGIIRAREAVVRGVLPPVGDIDGSFRPRQQSLQLCAVEHIEEIQRHHVVDAEPDMFDVMLNAVKHPVPRHQYNVMVDITTRQNFALSAAATQ